MGNTLLWVKSLVNVPTKQGLKVVMMPAVDWCLLKHPDWHVYSEKVRPQLVLTVRKVTEKLEHHAQQSSLISLDKDVEALTEAAAKCITQTLEEPLKHLFLLNCQQQSFISDIA